MCRITLNNGETWVENTNSVGWWRSLLTYSRKNNLEIQKFIVNDTEWLNLADGFFMLFKTLNSNFGFSCTFKGYGWYAKRNNKARIMWYKENEEFAYTEVMKPAPNFITDIIIAKQNKHV